MSNAFEVVILFTIIILCLESCGGNWWGPARAASSAVAIFRRAKVTSHSKLSGFLNHDSSELNRFSLLARVMARFCRCRSWAGWVIDELAPACLSTRAVRPPFLPFNGDICMFIEVGLFSISSEQSAVTINHNNQM